MPVQAAPARRRLATIVAATICVSLVACPGLAVAARGGTVPCSGPGGGGAGLIAAISGANTGGSTTTITLVPGCAYVMTSVYDTEEYTGLPAVTTGLTIEAASPGAIIERRTVTPFGIFSVLAGGSLTLRNITVERGLAPDGFHGGGVHVHPGGALTLVSSRVTANGVLATQPQGAPFGGGIANLGSTTIRGSRVDHNSSTDDSNFTFAEGGGIWNVGTLSIDASSIDHNVATAPGPGILNASGGGLWNGGTATLVDTDVSLNTVQVGADGSAGGAGVLNSPSATLGTAPVLDVRGGRIDGNVATASGLRGVARGGGVSSAGDPGTSLMTLRDVEIARNAVEARAGAVVGSSAANIADGGGVDNGFESTATIIGGSIEDNIAVATLSTKPPDVSTHVKGGGVSNFSALTIIGTSVTGNTASVSGPSLVQALGGAIFSLVDGPGVDPPAHLVIAAAGVIANTATAAGGGEASGGGLYLSEDGATATIRRSSIGHNHPDDCVATLPTPGCTA